MAHVHKQRIPLPTKVIQPIPSISPVVKQRHAIPSRKMIARTGQRKDNESNPETQTEYERPAPKRKSKAHQSTETNEVASGMAGYERIFPSIARNNLPPILHNDTLPQPSIEEPKPSPTQQRNDFLLSDSTGPPRQLVPLSSVFEAFHTRLDDITRMYDSPTKLNQAIPQEPASQDLPSFFHGTQTLQPSDTSRSRTIEEKIDEINKYIEENPLPDDLKSSFSFSLREAETMNKTGQLGPQTPNTQKKSRLNQPKAAPSLTPILRKTPLATKKRISFINHDFQPPPLQTRKTKSSVSPPKMPLERRMPVKRPKSSQLPSSNNMAKPKRAISPRKAKSNTPENLIPCSTLLSLSMSPGRNYPAILGQTYRPSSSPAQSSQNLAETFFGLNDDTPQESSDPVCVYQKHDEANNTWKLSKTHGQFNFDLTQTLQRTGHAQSHDYGVQARTQMSIEQTSHTPNRLIETQKTGNAVNFDGVDKQSEKGNGSADFGMTLPSSSKLIPARFDQTQRRTSPKRKTPTQTRKEKEVIHEAIIAPPPVSHVLSTILSPIATTLPKQVISLDFQGNHLLGVPSLPLHPTPFIPNTIRPLYLIESEGDTERRLSWGFEALRKHASLRRRMRQKARNRWIMYGCSPQGLTERMKVLKRRPLTETEAAEFRANKLKHAVIMLLEKNCLERGDKPRRPQPKTVPKKKEKKLEDEAVWIREWKDNIRARSEAQEEESSSESEALWTENARRIKLNPSLFSRRVISAHDHG
ncbi:hypothetical protein BLNAU_12490 [Blattamonas nauphoetae]|uniref:Uncharacterized protein n=1 Tax=Blattamonas nauphoetae TaxID=2049346 RepID=A0ABQ9XQU1_9EUKA|nr:hypothetical protein BLNAU_12490 [Blattamonas nauphoetae]